MRIKEHEKNAFIEVLSSVMDTHSKAALYLYGSRVNDALKGGDIDIMLLADEASVTRLAPQKYRLLVEFKKRIGDQRIDFCIYQEEEAKHNAFVQQALSQAIVLKEW